MSHKFSACAWMAVVSGLAVASPIEIIAGPGDSVSNRLGITVSNYLNAVIASDGSIAFAAEVSGGSAISGAVLWDIGTSDLVMVAAEGDAAPGVMGSFGQIGSHVSIVSSNRTAFIADLGTSAPSGVWRAQDDTVSLVAIDGQEAPGLMGSSFLTPRPGNLVFQDLDGIVYLDIGVQSPESYCQYPITLQSNLAGVLSTTLLRNALSPVSPPSPPYPSAAYSWRIDAGGTLGVGNRGAFGEHGMWDRSPDCEMEQAMCGCANYLGISKSGGVLGIEVSGVEIYNPEGQPYVTGGGAFVVGGSTLVGATNGSMLFVRQAESLDFTSRQAITMFEGPTLVVTEVIAARDEVHTSAPGTAEEFDGSSFTLFDSDYAGQARRARAIGDNLDIVFMARLYDSAEVTSSNNEGVWYRNNAVGSPIELMAREGSVIPGTPVTATGGILADLVSGSQINDDGVLVAKFAASGVDYVYAFDTEFDFGRIVLKEGDSIVIGGTTYSVGNLLLGAGDASPIAGGYGLVNDCTIVCVAELTPTAGQADKYVLRIQLPHPGDWNGDCAVDSSDFLAYLSDYTNCTNGADLNGDEVCDSADFLLFLNRYSAERCTGA